MIRVLNAKLYRMQENAHHLDRNDGLLTSQQILVIFVPKLLYFNVVCIDLFVLFIVILISLLALSPVFYTRFLITYSQHFIR